MSKQCREKLSSRRDNEDRAQKIQCYEFSFLSGVSPGEDLDVDSGATSNMIKDRDMFVNLDESFKGSVSNAIFSESKILRKG